MIFGWYFCHSNQAKKKLPEWEKKKWSKVFCNQSSGDFMSFRWPILCKTVNQCTFSTFKGDYIPTCMDSDSWFTFRTHSVPLFDHIPSAVNAHTRTKIHWKPKWKKKKRKNPQNEQLEYFALIFTLFVLSTQTKNCAWYAYSNGLCNDFQ